VEQQSILVWLLVAVAQVVHQKMLESAVEVEVQRARLLAVTAVMDFLAVMAVLR
jgi:hypothetical protein